MAIVRFEHNGKLYDIDVEASGLGGLNNTESKEYRQLVAMLKYSLDNDGKLPNITPLVMDKSITNTNDFERKYGIRFSGSGTEYWGEQKLIAAAKSGLDYLNDPTNQDAIEERAQASQQSAGQLDPYYTAMMDRNNPDSVYNQIYGAFRDQGTIGYEQSLIESQRAERDLGAQNAQDRSQLMDQIRSDRRTKLRSGLSSAQIANDEIQSQFIAQNLANQNARDFYNMRGQNAAQYATNDQNAMLQAYNMFSTQNLGPIMGQQYASYVGDAIKYGERADANPNIWKHIKPQGQ